MTIFGAVSGAESDWEHNLFTNSSKAVPYRKVGKRLVWLMSLLTRFKILFAGPLIFATSIALIKISTLILYTRIFVTKGFRLACYMVMTLTTGWFLASIFVRVLQSFLVNPAEKMRNSAPNIPIQASLEYLEFTRPT